jgi:hypothetical protein
MGIINDPAAPEAFGRTCPERVFMVYNGCLISCSARITTCLLLVLGEG